MKLTPSIKAKAKAIIDGRSMKSRSNREALEALANEAAGSKPYVSRKGFAGRGENNFEVNGEVVDKKTTVKNLEDGIYMVKGGVTKKMKTRNKLNAVICVTYRTLPKKDKAGASEKKAPAKKTEKIVAATKAPKTPEKKAPAKKEAKKAPEKKAPAKAPAKKVVAGKGKRR